VHIPDGFIDGPTSLGAAGMAAAGLGVSVRRAADALDDRRAPLAGLVAAFVFAVQMLNFPVASGTSGHLLGAVLAVRPDLVHGAADLLPVPEVRPALAR
jgi:cobalt/nickel transport system permease protein